MAPGSSPMASAMRYSSSARNRDFGLMLSWLSRYVLSPVFLATSARFTDLLAR